MTKIKDIDKSNIKTIDLDNDQEKRDEYEAHIRSSVSGNQKEYTKEEIAAEREIVQIGVAREANKEVQSLMFVAKGNPTNLDLTMAAAIILGKYLEVTIKTLKATKHRDVKIEELMKKESAEFTKDVLDQALKLQGIRKFEKNPKQ